MLPIYAFIMYKTNLKANRMQKERTENDMERENMENVKNGVLKQVYACYMNL